MAIHFEEAMKLKRIVLTAASVYLAIGIVIGFVQLLFTSVFQPDCKGTTQHALWEGRRTADKTESLEGASDESFALYLFRVGRGALGWLPDVSREVVSGNMTAGNYLRGGYRCVEADSRADVFNAAIREMTRLLDEDAGPLSDGAPATGSRAADLLREASESIAGAQMATWTSQEGRFSIMMPGEPLYRQSDPIRAESGPIHTYRAQSQSHSYMLSYSDYRLRPEEAKDFWNRSKDFYAEGAELLRYEDASLGNRPAKHIVMKVPSGEAHYFAILDGVRLYVIAFGAPANSNIPAEADQILQSFRILN